MEDQARIWGNLKPSEMEVTGFVLQSDQRSREVILAATFLTSRFLSMEVVVRTFKQIRCPTNDFQICNQGDHIVLPKSHQFGPSLWAPPYCSIGKDLFFVPGFFEKLSSEPPWRNKVLAGISEGTDNSGDMAITRGDQQLLETKFDATAITTKPFQNSNLDEELMIKEIPKKTPTNLESQLYRTLMLTLHSKLAMVSNSTTTMGSPKSQPIINESISFNAPLISVVEVKTDIVA